MVLGFGFGRRRSEIDEYLALPSGSEDEDIIEGDFREIKDSKPRFGGYFSKERQQERIDKYDKIASGEEGLFANLKKSNWRAEEKYRERKAQLEQDKLDKLERLKEKRAEKLIEAQIRRAEQSGRKTKKQGPSLRQKTKQARSKLKTTAKRIETLHPARQPIYGGFSLRQSVTPNLERLRQATMLPTNRIGTANNPFKQDFSILRNPPKFGIRKPNGR